MKALYISHFLHVCRRTHLQKKRSSPHGKPLFSHFCIPLTAENISAPLIYRRKLTRPMRLTR